MSSRAAGSKTTALLRHPYNLQSKLCDKCQTSQNMEIFKLLLLNFLTSDLRKVAWCGHVEKSLVVSQPQRQRCCVHGYVASTGTWRNECNESTDGKNIRSLFLHHFLYKINLWKQNISHFDFTCFFTVSTSKIMTGCFRSEFFCRFRGLTVLGVSFEDALPWKLSLVANRPSLGITTEGLRLRTVRRNDFSWKSQDCYKDIEYLHKIWISRSKIRVQMLIHLFTIFA